MLSDRSSSVTLCSSVWSFSHVGQCSGAVAGAWRCGALVRTPCRDFAPDASQKVLCCARAPRLSRGAAVVTPMFELMHEEATSVLKRPSNGSAEERRTHARTHRLDFSRVHGMTCIYMRSTRTLLYGALTKHMSLPRDEQTMPDDVHMKEGRGQPGRREHERRASVSAVE